MDSLRYTDGTASRRKISWSADQDSAILQMRTERFPWNAIAERVGRTVEACSCRYTKLVPKADRLSYRTSCKWTTAEEKQLRNLHEANKSVAQIAHVMKRPHKTIYNKLNYLTKTRVHFERISRLYVPTEQLEDRRQREAVQRDITGEFFGDPPPGFSALDRREQRA